MIGKQTSSSLTKADRTRSAKSQSALVEAGANQQPLSLSPEGNIAVVRLEDALLNLVEEFWRQVIKLACKGCHQLALCFL
jgi:hypothetical protein